MDAKALNIVLLVVGIVLIVVFAGADVIGVGSAPGFGWKQITGTVIGAVLCAVGAVRLLGKTAA
jgi:hypothetical protein